MSGIAESLQIVKERIKEACERSKRDPKTVKIIGATKGVDPERIREAYREGLRDFGENYVQEALKKAEQLKGMDITWHMIGHIQTNKIKYFPRIFSFVHSVDREKVIDMLDDLETSFKILFQVNISGEERKSGTRDLDELFFIVEKALNCRYLEPIGLMVMPPYFEDPERSRPFFRQLREILDKVNEKFGIRLSELSMGMSNDFEVAVEEGSTMVRIGRAIFGERI